LYSLYKYVEISYQTTGKFDVVGLRFFSVRKSSNSTR